MPTIASILDSKGATVHTIESWELVSEAVARINELRIGSLLVTDEDHTVIGILTERDILVRVVAAGHAAYDVTVDEVMTRALVTVAPTASLEDAMRLMTETRHRHLPVTNNGKISGLVSMGDLTKKMVDDRDAQISDLVLYITHG